MFPAAIVFDFDGVLADSEPLHLRAFQETLATAGITLTAEDYYARYLGYDDEGAFKAVLADAGRLLDGQDLRALVDDKSRRLPALLSAPGVLMPGARACVERLAQARPLAIASGALRREIELVLEARELRAPFSVIVAAGETPRSKPHPDPYARAVALLGEQGLVPPATQPAQCVAIEDSHWGLVSAREAGLRCVAITSSYPRETLGEADHVIDSLDELTLDLLANVAGAR
jgi:HAD superfamily hydrolase (TIGR01509 family)